MQTSIAAVWNSVSSSLQCPDAKDGGPGQMETLWEVGSPVATRPNELHYSHGGFR